MAVVGMIVVVDKVIVKDFPVGKLLEFCSVLHNTQGMMGNLVVV